MEDQSDAARGNSREASLRQALPPAGSGPNVPQPLLGLSVNRRSPYSQAGVTAAAADLEAGGRHPHGRRSGASRAGRHQETVHVEALVHTIVRLVRIVRIVASTHGPC